MKIYIGGDHTGYELKEKIKTYLSEMELGYELVDRGAFEYDKDDDYPDFISMVAESVVEDKGSFGIVLGGSGQGEAMCANRVKGARACVFYAQKLPVEKVDIHGDESQDSFEIVELARKHNDANIISIGTRFATEDEAKFAIELFLATKFEGEERHVRRIKKMDLLEPRS